MRAILTVALALVLFCLPPVFSQAPQTPDDFEKTLFKLPPDQRVYERFRRWITTQPVEVQRGPDVAPKYREYLTTRGFGPADIDAQLKIIADRGRNLEVQRWNEILTAEKPKFNTNPNGFLVEVVKGRKPGSALDVGMGQGRNAIWLAQNGWIVTGFDPAEKAVALANQTAERLGVHLTTEITTDDKFDFGENRWDLIVLSYVEVRALAQKVERSLKPHGLFVIEAFHNDAAKDRPIGRSVVFDNGEMIRLFPHLRIVRYEEPLATADFGQQQMRVVRYCGEKVE